MHPRSAENTLKFGHFTLLFWKSTAEKYAKITTLRQRVQRKGSVCLFTLPHRLIPRLIPHCCSHFHFHCHRCLYQ